MTGGAAFNEVFLDGGWVDRDVLLDRLGQGWAVARTTLRPERASLGRGGTGGRGVLDPDRLIGLARATGATGDSVRRLQLMTLLTTSGSLSGIVAAGTRRSGPVGLIRRFARLRSSR
jgi:hypothetical protein